MKECSPVKPSISQAEIDARIGPHLDELLKLWWAEQGEEKSRDLELIAAAIPFPRTGRLRVLDLCCGPGDVGRAIHRACPDAEVDGVDRDPFLTAIARGVNRRERIPGKVVVADLQDTGWSSGLGPQYDVVATANALHWFDVPRAEALLVEVHGLLRKGGVFLFVEPASVEAPFSSGFSQWSARQPQRYSRENWERFWTRANAILGYDHIKLLGARPTGRIDDDMTVAGWLGLVRKAGFAMADVLLRDKDEVIVAAVK
jgi:SAM-dependent methyltransferase